MSERVRGYRKDPEWLSAREDYVAEIDGESIDDELYRRILAARRMYEIEQRYSALPREGAA